MGETLRLRDALESRGAPDLKSMGRLVASSLPTRKGELADLLYGKLTDPAFVRGHYEGLDETSRRAVQEAVHADGVLDVDAFRAKYNRPPLLTSDHGYNGAKPAAPLELLIFRSGIPAEVLAILQRFVPKPEEFVLEGSEEAAETFTPRHGDPVALTRADTERAAMHDLLAVLELVRAGKLAVGEKTGLPGTGALRAISARMLLPDYFAGFEGLGIDEVIRPFGLVMAAQTGGLAKAIGSRLQLTRAGEAFLREPTVERLRDAWNRWLRSDSPDELRRIRALKGQQSRRTHLTPPSSRKPVIAEALARCPIGRWVSTEEFLRGVRAWQLTFDVEPGDYTGLYTGFSAEYGWLGGSSVDYFTLVDAQYILVCLWEYAASFGAVDVLYTHPGDADYPTPEYHEEDYFSRYDGLAYFRVNALGAYLLGLSAEYAGPAQAEEPPAFTMLPNLDVAITDPAHLAPNDRAFLERIGVPHGEGVYHLEAESILTAVEEGLAVGAIAEFLQRRGAKAMPQTVTRFLDDLQTNASALAPPSPAILVPCRDPHVRELLTHDTVLAKLVLPAGADSLVVREGDEAAFRRRLKKLGYVLPPR